MDFSKNPHKIRTVFERVGRIDTIRYLRFILRVMHRSPWYWYLQHFHVSWFFEAFTN